MIHCIVSIKHAQHDARRIRQSDPATGGNMAEFIRRNKIFIFILFLFYLFIIRRNLRQKQNARYKMATVDERRRAALPHRSHNCKLVS